MLWHMLPGKPGTAASSPSQTNPGSAHRMEECLGMWCQQCLEMLSVQRCDKKCLALSERGEGGVTCNQENNLASLTRVTCARAMKGPEDTRGCKGRSVKSGCRWKMSVGGQDALCLSDRRLRSDLITVGV